MQKFIGLGVMLGFCVLAQAERMFGDFTSYDPSSVWKNETQSLGPEDVLYQALYSRGNDEGHEGNYETATLFTNLMLDYQARNVVLNLRVFCNISTPEPSHAKSVYPYYLRTGKLAAQEGYHYLTQVTAQSPFDFLDKNFKQALLKGQKVDARGQWIASSVPLGQINLDISGKYQLLTFVQQLRQNKFPSQDEFHDSVKHKIYTEIEVQNGAITFVRVVMAQPQQLGENKSKYDKYLSHQGTYLYQGMNWSQVAGPSAPRFPEKGSPDAKLLAHD